MLKFIVGLNILKRTILYFPGFDPRGASAYHSITNKQFHLHCLDNGLEGATSNRRRNRDQTNSWNLQCLNDGCEVKTTFKVMSWDDLIRQYWVRNDIIAAIKGAKAFFLAVKLGIIKHLVINSWPIAISASLPFFQLALITFLILLAIFSLTIISNSSILLGLGILITTIAILFYALSWTRTFQIPWLARMIRYIVKASQNDIFENWDKQEKLCDIILETIQDDANDEVLIISHSLGTQIALLAMSAAIKKAPSIVNNAIDRKQLVFITLGHNIPIMSKTCPTIAASLKVVGESSVLWLDISSATDPASTVMIDAYQLQFGGEPRVHIQNANFFKTFSNEIYKAKNKNRFDMHFLYIMFPNLNSKLGFNFYRLISGKSLLAEKFPNKPKAVRPYYKFKSFE